MVTIIGLLYEMNGDKATATLMVYLVSLIVLVTILVNALCEAFSRGGSCTVRNISYNVTPGPRP